MGEDGIVTRIDIVEDGAVVGVSDDWLAVPEGGIRIDINWLDMEDDYGPYTWDGAPFTGVVYSFDTFGVCGAEEIFEDGLESDLAGRTWYASGAPHQAFANDSGSSWFEDGRLQSRSIGDRTLLNVVADDGVLSALVLGDAGLLDMSTLAQFERSDSFMLVGPAIDSAMIAMLVDRIDLGTVTSLSLTETGVGSEIADILVTFKNLTALHLARNPSLGEDDAERIRSMLANCTVDYEPPDDDDEA